MPKYILGILLLLILLVESGQAAAGTLLVYRSGGSEYSLESALTILGFSYDVRDAANPVTAIDIASHSALIVGWSAGGYNMAGLNATILQSGITGNRLLSGHDADYHAASSNASAQTLLTRYVDFAAGSPGNPGFLGFPIYDINPFSYLPGAWGVTSFGGLNEDVITSITSEGLNSGLYQGLTPLDLSNWSQSYHAGFTAWGPDFKSFEIGSYQGGANVTIGTTVTSLPPTNPIPEPASWILIAAGLGVFGLARGSRKR